jgi:hypothetical protein
LEGKAVLYIGNWHFHGPKALDAETTAAPSPLPSPNKNGESQQPLSMRQLFDSDFDGLAKIAMQSEIRNQNDSYIFAYAKYIDIPTNSFFIGLFLERTEITVINIVSCRLNNIISQLDYVHFKITIAGDSRNTATDTAHSQNRFSYILMTIQT